MHGVWQSLLRPRTETNADASVKKGEEHKSGTSCRVRLRFPGPRAKLGSPTCRGTAIHKACSSALDGTSRKALANNFHLEINDTNVEHVSISFCEYENGSRLVHLGLPQFSTYLSLAASSTTPGPPCSLMKLFRSGP